MSISRTEVEIVVTGATAAEAGLRSVAAAESAVASQAMAATPAVNRLSQSMQDMTKAGMTYNSMTMTWEKNTTKATQATKAMIWGIEDMAEKTSVLSTVAGGASKTITLMMRAAYLLPGLGFAGMVGGIIAGVSSLIDAMKGVGTQAGIMSQAVVAGQKAINDAISESVRKYDELRVAQARAGLGMVGGALGVKGEQLPFSQAMSAQRVQSEIEAARETQRKALAGTAELERKKASLEFDKAKAGKVFPLDPLAIEFRRRQIEINEQRRGYEAEYNRAAAALRRLEAPYDSVGKERAAKARGIGPGGSPSSPFGGAMFGINPAPGEDLTPFGIESARAQDAARKARDDAAFARMNADIDAARKAEAAQAAGAAAGAREFGKQAAPSALTDAMAQMGDSFTGTFDRMAAGATDAAGIMVQAIGTITTALGSMMTNLIISGDAGAKGLKKMAGNALAGLSAQAFGYALMLEAMAVAATYSTVLGWAAPGLATAGGVMAGAGVALGVSARLLGADKIGAQKGGAKGGSGGGAPASAAGTNPFGPSGGQQTQVVVYIGSEVVTRGVQTETRRTALRGGITEGRMAMAS